VNRPGFAGEPHPISGPTLVRNAGFFLH
jgi:hypothetical protein